MRMIASSPMSSPCDSCLDLVDEAVHRFGDSGKLSRSQGPSNCGGIAANSSAVIVTMPVTWVTLPSEYVRWTDGMNL